MPEYREPVAQLLTIGKIKFGDPERDYRPLGFGPAHIPELVRLALDRELYDQYPDGTAWAGPAHAIFALGQLGPIVGLAAVPLFDLFRRVEEDEDALIGEGLPAVLARIGPCLLPALTDYLADESNLEWARVAAAHAIQEVASLHPESRTQAVAILSRQLEHYPDQNRTVTTFVVHHLINLRAAEAAPLIAAACATGAVDPGVDGGWPAARMFLPLTREQASAAAEFARQAVDRQGRRQDAAGVASEPFRDESEDDGAPSQYSYFALDRILEIEMATDPKLRDQVRLSNRPLVRDFRDWSEDRLLAFLRECGYDLSRERFTILAGQKWSAEAIVKELGLPTATDGPFAEDRAWCCLAILWERWRPDQPSFEMLDGRMQQGYELAQNDGAAAVRLWLAVWRDLVRVADRHRLTTLEELDGAFRGTQSVSNWLDDLDTAFYHTPMPHERVAFIREVLARYPEATDLVSTFRRGLAAAYLELGERETVATLYRDWLGAEPEWGWGWIGWADSYRGFGGTPGDPARAEALLRRGLVVPGVEDIVDLYEGLIGLYEETKQPEKLRVVQQELRDYELRHYGPEPTDDDDDLPVLSDDDSPPPATIRRTAPKIGRNEPCPCGSGKKYKRCCGANET